MELFRETFATYALTILPWFCIGVGVALVIEKRLDRAVIQKYLREFTYRRVVVAELLGMLSPLSIMSFLPIAGEFIELGANPGLLFSFFLAERAYDFQSFFIIASFFGLRFALLNGAAIFLSLIVTALTLKKSVLTFLQHETHRQNHFWQRQLKLVGVVVLGITVAALLRTFIPIDIFRAYAGSPLTGTVIAIAAGFSLYFGPVVGNYPVARAFADLGMSPAAVFLFLTVSPVFNAVIIMLFGAVVGLRKALLAIGTYAVTAFILSLLFSELL